MLNLPCISIHIPNFSLDFQNFNFSTVRTVKKVELHHYAKFCQNRFNRGRDIAIYRFFKMAATAILDFRNLKFLKFVTVKRVEQHHVLNFVKIARTATEISRFFIFLKMGAAAILDFQNFKFSTVGTVKKVELHQCAKFHQNSSNRGQDMVFLDFSRWRPPPSWIFEISIF